MQALGGYWGHLDPKELWDMIVYWSSIWDFQLLLGGEGAGLSSIMLDLNASTSKLDRVVLYFCCTLFLLE